MSTGRITVAGVALVAALGLAGCGGGVSGAQTGAKAPAATSTPIVKVGHSSLGNILVDGRGRTLYLFTQDGKNTNSMNCDAACKKLWPPLEGRPKAGSGADAHLIGTTKGSKPQATYAGHPLYHFAKDKKAGDLKGQGFGNVWYVLDAHGKAIKKAVPTPSGTGGGGYGY